MIARQVKHQGCNNCNTVVQSSEYSMSRRTPAVSPETNNQGVDKSPDCERGRRQAWPLVNTRAGARRFRLHLYNVGRYLCVHEPRTRCHICVRSRRTATWAKGERDTTHPALTGSSISRLDQDCGKDSYDT